MPNKQKHRGQHSDDKRLFGKKFIPSLQEATANLSWLLTRGYAEKSALKTVGDRYRLNQRQRMAVQRAACAEASVNCRTAKEVPLTAVKGKPVIIDGYNLLITVECALSGAYLFKCMDGCIRDIASIHGSYRKVEETVPAVTLIGEALLELGVSKANWHFDSPVSNSGRLKALLYELAVAKGWNWDIALNINPDLALAKSSEIVISSDGWVLEHCQQWANFCKWLVEDKVETKTVIGLPVS